jgi:phosphatidylglycerophosphate synthase
MNAKWSVVQAVLCLCAGVASFLLLTLWPLALAGGASLFVFFALARPRMTRLFGIGTANAVTLLRLALLIASALVLPTWWSFGLVFALDGVDGYFARRFQEETPFGAHFDMETDALLVALLSMTTVFAGAPVWALIIGALRYVYVVARALRRSRAAKERRSTFGRYVFSITMCALLLSLTPVPELVKTAALGIAVVCLFISFAPDFAALRSTNA